MRRNDLTTEEVRFERLLRSLEYGAAAPDSEFLRQLRETSTAAFVAAQPARPLPTRAASEPPVHPAAGRRRLQVLRVAMLTSVTAMLCLGMFSHMLFPSRGVELRVALSNLNRASSGVIEFQNGAVSNTLLFVRDDVAVRRLTEFAGGNAELFDGNSNFFLNRGNNSVHLSLPEEADFTETAVEEKLLANLNVNDPQVQLSVLNQRPQSESEENGKRLLYYNYKQPIVSGDGTTLTINATVNASDNTLVAMNSEVVDAAGNSRFRANADVKSLNTPLPADRFQVDPQAAQQTQIAMVEDVQGNAYVDDLTPLLNPANYVEDLAVFTQSADRNFGMAGNRAKSPGGYGAGGGMGGAPPAVAYTETSRFGVNDAPQNTPAPVGNSVKLLQQGRAKNLSGQIFDPQGPNGGTELPRRGGAGLRAPAVAPSAEEMESNERVSKKQVGNLQATDKVDVRPEIPAKTAPSGGGVKITAKNSDPAPASPAPQTDAAPVVAEAPLTAGATPKSRMIIPKDLPKGAPQPDSATESMNDSPTLAKKLDTVTGGGELSRNLGLNPTAQQENKGRYTNPPGKAGNSRAQDANSAAPRLTERIIQQQLKLAAELEEQKNLTGQLGGTEKEQVEPYGKSDLNGQLDASANSLRLPNGAYSLGNGLQAGGLNNSYSLGLVRRQVSAQSELLPGGMLNTDDSTSNVVRARLVNGADVIVGPSSKVLMLKPTELRLQAGELMLNVPAGDQVDLLGPDPTGQPEAENNKSYTRRGNVQLKGFEPRRQVTGRGMYRVENRQLQQMEQDPAWLTNYYVKLSAAKSAPVAAPKEPAPAANSKDAPGFQKARAPEPAAKP